MPRPRRFQGPNTPTPPPAEPLDGIPDPWVWLDKPRAPMLTPEKVEKYLQRPWAKLIEDPSFPATPVGGGQSLRVARPALAAWLRRQHAQRNAHSRAAIVERREAALAGFVTWAASVREHPVFGEDDLRRLTSGAWSDVVALAQAEEWTLPVSGEDVADALLRRTRARAETLSHRSSDGD